MNSSDPVLRATGLGVKLRSGRPIVDDFNLAISGREIVGIVGESGSGKTTTGMALLGYTQPGMMISAGTIVVDGVTVFPSSDRQRRSARGHLISYVPQNPGAALNPSLRIRDQLRWVMRRATRTREGVETPETLLESVHLPTTKEFLQRFPHQLSGGQQQRVAIAMALCSKPRVCVMDEPATGLDVVTQAGIIRQVRELADGGLAVVYVSHDMAVLSELVDKLMVMYGGRIVEAGPARELLHHPAHPYTQALLRAVPDAEEPHRLVGIPGVAAGSEAWVDGCAFRTRCSRPGPVCEERTPSLEHGAHHHRQVRCFFPDESSVLRAEPIGRPDERETSPPVLAVNGVTAEYRVPQGAVVATYNVDISISASECVAIVGESGSGKTTLGRCIVGLHQDYSGDIRYHGVPLPHSARSRTANQLKSIQPVFQNPADSLNPKRDIVDQVARPARVLLNLSPADARQRALELLDAVRLPRRLAHRFPLEVSGGERQRIAIARALAAGPDVLVCDEITSSLDVSVQAAVMDVLGDLRREFGLAIILISHDIALVASVASRAIVLKDGRVCESGAVRDLLDHPAADYTRRLIRSVPRMGALS
jgi:peptide/nickel transport system ATP-binding protein